MAEQDCSWQEADVSGKVVERRFDTREPVMLMPGLLTPLPWPDWSARVRSLDVDGARADYIELGPYEMEVPPHDQRPDDPVQMMLTVILTGTSTGEVDGRPVTLAPKQAMLIDGRAAMRFRSPEPVSAVRIFVEEDHLPADVLARWTLPFALLKNSPLVTGCIGFITGLLQVNNPVVEPHDEVAVSQPLVALQASLLDEALHQDQPVDPTPPVRGDGPAARRQQIEAHIEQHLADRDLDVGTIAGALDVTARTVHGAFAGGPDTVTAHIRARRLARAQALLSVRQEPPNVAALAARVGLSRDQLTRAFRAATGTTAPDWWEQRRADR